MSKKTPAILIFVAILIIALVIILWLSSRKAQGSNGDGEEALNNYIVIDRVNDRAIFIKFYNQQTWGIDTLILLRDLGQEDWEKRLTSYYKSGQINQIQYDDISTQLYNS